MKGLEEEDRRGRKKRRGEEASEVELVDGRKR